MGNPPTARLCLFGAAPDTTNLGVLALFESVTSGLARRIPGLDLAVFDNGWGERAGRLRVGEDDFRFRLIGGRNSRRYHRHDSLWNIRVCSWLGGLGNPGSRALLRADAALDISGGDSFSDLYGAKRFAAVTLPKRIALERGIPLVLLPQTYGPFEGARERRLARRIVRGAALAWARDERSFTVLRDLLGDDFDPERHRCGVDVAFGLEPRDPVGKLPAELRGWLEDARVPTLGCNVSGLVYGDPAESRSRFGIRADYREVVHRSLERVLAGSGARLLLLPHVGLDPVHAPRDSDGAACEAVAAHLSRRFPGRVGLLPGNLAAGEAKWVISRLHWFCGTRMHSTIAALSSGVPVAAIAYSDKTQGVFETCGQGGRVVDPRALDTPEAVARLVGCFEAADATRADLARRVPAVIERARAQLDEIAAWLRSPHRAPSPG